MNTIRADNGGEVYEDQIALIADQYINGLEDPEDIRNAMCFRGLLQTIYETLFRPATPQENNRGTCIDITDINLLNTLWRAFTRLCYRNRHIPTIKRFALMIGLSPQTLANWGNHTTRANSAHFESYKSWLSECESALEDQTSEHSSIGCIFNLKANYGWREATPSTEEYLPTGQQSTPEQIRQKYENTPKPQLPQLDDD